MLSCVGVCCVQIDLAVQLYPGVHAAPLILGTIAGCGGRLLADGIMTGWQVHWGVCTQELGPVTHTLSDGRDV